MEQTVIVSSLVTEQTSPVVPGSIPVACRGCGEYVWVAPSSRRMEGFERMDIMCTQCAIDDGMEPKDIAPATPEQLAELKSTYQDDEWPWVEAILRESGWLV